MFVLVLNAMELRETLMKVSTSSVSVCTARLHLLTVSLCACRYFVSHLLCKEASPSLGLTLLSVICDPRCVGQHVSWRRHETRGAMGRQVFWRIWGFVAGTIHYGDCGSINACSRSHASRSRFHLVAIVERGAMTLGFGCRQVPVLSSHGTRCRL